MSSNKHGAEEDLQLAPKRRRLETCTEEPETEQQNPDALQQLATPLSQGQLPSDVSVPDQLPRSASSTSDTGQLPRSRRTPSVDSREPASLDLTDALRAADEAILLERDPLLSGGQPDRYLRNANAEDRASTYYTASEGYTEEEKEAISYGRAIQKRQLYVDEYNAAQEAWEEWRNSYDEVLEAHERRTGPCVEGWNHDSSRSEFEAQFLREGSRRAREYSRAEEVVYRAMRLAAKVGLEPFDWQDWDFPDDGHYYYQEEEDGMIESAPVEAIVRWRSNLPDNAADMAGPRVVDAHYNPAGYGGDHDIEWPADLELMDGEVEAWDSFSVVAERVKKRRIEEAHVGPDSILARVQDFQSTPHRPDQKVDRQLMSHYF